MASSRRALVAAAQRHMDDRQTPPLRLSNSFVGARERERPYGLESMCDTIVYSHEVGCCKPQPEAYLLTCQGIGVEPFDAVFVDDSDEGVQGARAVGLHAIQHLDTSTTIRALDEYLGRG
ncbi:MAG TPA: HAD-IA family hydrolase [Nitriliruptorales bacterium]